MQSRAEIEKLDSVWKAPGFVPILIAVACAFGAWSLLLPVLPLAVIDGGGSDTLAGGATAIFMLCTVLTQTQTPRMLRIVGYSPVMIVSAFLLGLPALGHLLGMDPWIVLLFSGLRGIGFGALSVAESAVVAELVPARFLGKASGMLGVFIGLAQLVFLSLGLELAHRVSYGAVYISAAVVGVAAALLCLRVPRIKPTPPAPVEDDDAPRVRMWKLVLVPALTVSTMSMSFGAVSSFLPAAARDVVPGGDGAVFAGYMLSVAAASSMIFRYWAGIWADHQGEPGGLMIPSQVFGAVGTFLLAATVQFTWPAWVLVIAAIFFGGAFGVVQNEALLSMFYRLPRSKISEASAIWNISYDAGTGVGSALYGLLIAQFAYSGAFYAGAIVITLGIGMTALDMWLGRHRVAEYDNLRTRLTRARIVESTR